MDKRPKPLFGSNSESGQKFRPSEDNIRLVIKDEIRKEYRTELQKEIYKFIESVGKQVVISELKKVNISKVLTERFDNLMQQQLKPIITKAVRASADMVSGRINKQLKQIINLKTSTVMEIKSEITKIPPQVESEVLKKLEQEFPQYYDKIKGGIKLIEEQK